MVELVVCRSESEYPERPVSFYWNGQELMIQSIVSRWRTPEGKWFLVLAENDEVFTLIYNEISDEWSVQATGND
jgi:hypothetical protein